MESLYNLFVGKNNNVVEGFRKGRRRVRGRGPRKGVRRSGSRRSVSRNSGSRWRGSGTSGKGYVHGPEVERGIYKGVRKHGRYNRGYRRRYRDGYYGRRYYNDYWNPFSDYNLYYDYPLFDYLYDDYYYPTVSSQFSLLNSQLSSLEKPGNVTVEEVDEEDGENVETMESNMDKTESSGKMINISFRDNDVMMLLLLVLIIGIMIYLAKN
jgi:hypothetical protein